MAILDTMLGRRLATHEEEGQRVGVTAGIPLLGLDALASSAYGPEAALTILIPLGVLGLGYIVPISGLIVALLLIVFVSYRQTIAAYPNGGGSYTVAQENLGQGAGLLAAAALMLDYVLVVAVGISAGWRAVRAAQYVAQRCGCGGDRHHAGGSFGGKVCCGGVDYPGGAATAAGGIFAGQASLCGG